MTAEASATREGAQPSRPCSGAYSVPEGVAADGVLGCEGGTAQHDEDEDEVGEDVVVDELVAAHADPVGKPRHGHGPRQGPSRRASPFSMLGLLSGDRSDGGQLSAVPPMPPPSKPEPPDHQPPGTLRLHTLRALGATALCRCTTSDHSLSL